MDQPSFQQQLLDAIRCGNVKTLKHLLAAAPNLNVEDESGSTPLCIAAKCRLDLVKLLHHHGADINFIGSDKISALHWSVEYDNDQINAYLLANGASVHAQDKLQETPLHWAAWTGHIKSAQQLLAYGAEMTATNGGNLSPLDLAEQQEHTDLITLFRNR